MNIEQLARDVADKDKVDPWNKDLCTLTKEELQRLCNRVRNEALEEAAVKCYEMFAYRGGHGEPGLPSGSEIVAAIRSMKEVKT